MIHYTPDQIDTAGGWVTVTFGDTTGDVIIVSSDPISIETCCRCGRMYAANGTFQGSGSVVCRQCEMSERFDRACLGFSWHPAARQVEFVDPPLWPRPTHMDYRGRLRAERYSRHGRNVRERKFIDARRAPDEH